jgi:UDP-glucose 4-epimerase
MRILVTGGAGFIGSHVVDACLAAGHEVTVLDDLSTGRRENLPAGARFVLGSVLDAGVADLLRERGIEAVDHHAAQILVSRSMREPVFDAEVNAVGMVRLLEACRLAGVGRFVFASSGGAQYGEMERAPFTEDTPQRPLSVYGASKVAAEAYLGVYARQYGMTAVTLRYANVYGPRQDPSGEGGVVAVFTDAMLKGTAFRVNGDGEYLRDYVHVKDVAAANLSALSYPSSGTFNIGTGRGTTVNELFAMLSAVTGHRGDPVRGPARLGDLRRSVLDPSRAARDLGWKPGIDLERGLAGTVACYRGQ